MDKIRIVVYKNIQNPTDCKPLLIDPSWNKEQLLTCCSEALGIKAKKIFNESGNQLSSVNKLTDGTVLYISQGESFQVKRSQSRVSKNIVICMLGTAAVGKSAVTQRYVQNKFLKDYDPTIEDYYKKTVNVDQESVPLSILDTAGMEDYLPLIDDWIDKKDAFILLYSVEWRESMTKLDNFYQKIMHRYPSTGQNKISPVVVIAGNKIDSPNRQVSGEEGRKFAEKNGLRHFEISAATGQGVEEVFLGIIKELLGRKVSKSAAPPVPWYQKCDLL